MTLSAPGTFIILQNSPSITTLWSPSAERQELKSDPMQVQNSATHQASRKVTPCFVSGWSFVSYLTHPASNPALIAQDRVSLEVWAASRVGLVLLCVHTRQPSVTLPAPPLLTMALRDATLSPANTHLTWLTSAGRRASSCPCQLRALHFGGCE